MSKSRRLAYFALLYNAVIWGAAFPIVKPVFSYLTPLQFLTLRYGLAGLLSIPIFLTFYIKKHPKISEMIKPVLLELLGLVVPLYLLYEGMSRTSALEASLIGSTGPLFVILGGIIFLKERESKREWQGLALAFLGSFLLILEPLWNGHGFVGSSLTGNLLILSHNIIWGIYAVLAKKFYKKKPPLAYGSFSYLGTSLIYASLLASQSNLPSLTLLITQPSIIFPILYMAIPGGIIANLFYLYAASRIEVSEANLFTYLNGIFAIPASYLLLNEKPSMTTLFAIIVIAYGVYRAEASKSR